VPTRTRGVVGGAAERSRVALLLVDVINDLDFPGSAGLVRQALPMARRLAGLAARARAAGVPVVYVNDNFGRWQSDWKRQIEHCLADGVPGRPLAELLRPAATDYFVLKPKHSGFFSTTLETLLRHLGVDTLVLAGIATDICILFTANDAYMRDYHLFVPQDCVAANSPERSRVALRQMRVVLEADTRPSRRLTRARLRAGRRKGAAAFLERSVRAAAGAGSRG
jgi:nicotinamidase-related amidase